MQNNIKGGIKMITFKIISIQTERRIDGNSMIWAECVEDGKLIEVSCPSKLLTDKVKIKEILEAEYKHVTCENQIYIGDIL